MEAARLAGVQVHRIVFGAYIGSAVFASIAGILFAAKFGAGPPNIGGGYLLPAYAAAFLGSTIIRPGRFNVPGLVVAVFIVGIGINGLQLQGRAFWIVDVFQGGALLVAVVISTLMRRRKT